jgi:two-component system response regulator MprA
VAVLVVPGHEGAPAHSLDAGADDHFDLSVDDDELLARVRALVRRSPSGCRVLQVGDLRLDRSRRLVTRNGQLVDLTLTEYTILELLLRNVDVVLERATIYEVIWGVDLHNSSKALDVHIGGLRRKLEQHGSRMIHTVRGVGYVMWAPALRH